MKNIKAVLFDLDGTLLPMDQDIFVKTYFAGLAKALAPFGYDKESLVSAIWKATGAMIKNDGKDTNEKVFWKVFSSILGEEVLAHTPIFDKFYEEEFDKVKSVCGYTPDAKTVIDLVKSRGVRTVLATNPIFPAIATRKRMAWAGLSPDDFEFYTTYENSRHTKPNIAYYEDILSTLGLSAEECIMVGNDSTEDMIAQKLGMKVFLLTDCLINKENVDISAYEKGSFKELISYLEKEL